MEFERIRRRHTHIDIAPLVDMVFLLLLFFMLTYRVVAEHGIEVSLPESENSQIQDMAEIEIIVDANGDLYVNNTQINLDQLLGALNRLFSSKEQPLIIQADRQAHVGILVDIMDAARSSGFLNISILSQKK